MYNERYTWKFGQSGYDTNLNEDKLEFSSVLHCVQRSGYESTNTEINHTLKSYAHSFLYSFFSSTPRMDNEHKHWKAFQVTLHSALKALKNTTLP